MSSTNTEQLTLHAFDLKTGRRILINLARLDLNKRNCVLLELPEAEWDNTRRERILIGDEMYEFVPVSEVEVCFQPPSVPSIER